MEEAIRVVETDQQILACHEVMHQLRPHRAREAFVQRVRLQQQQGYHLVCLSLDGRPAALAGFRILENLFGGRVLYVDDLITDDAQRSLGLGSKLMTWLLARARDEGCDHLDLDSGNQRKDAHRFYLREGMRQDSLHFSMPVLPDGDG